MNGSNSIYVVTHKKCSIPQLEGYKPIFVGSDRPQEGFLSDNTGMNISSKNDSYCELTAQYWVWKNTNYDITGFVHYRRFFYYTLFSNKESDIVPLSQFISDLKMHDMVLPNYVYSRNSVIQDYSLYHNVKDINITRDVLKKYDPKTIEAFDKVMQSHGLAPYNMFVAPPTLYSEYMEWLFGLMEILEDRIDFSGYDSYNQRIFGFLGERLLNIWTVKKNLDIKRYPVHNNERTSYIDAMKNEFKKRIWG